MQNRTINNYLIGNPFPKVVTKSNDPGLVRQILSSKRRGVTPILNYVISDNKLKEKVSQIPLEI